jgi:hypothetical protein
MMKIAAAFASAVFVVLAGAAPGNALNSHSYVSATGRDTGACTLADPCATLATAVAKTGPGGEVSCRDGGDGNDPVTITQSLTIDCAGVPAANWYITIDGGGLSVVVTLRNLMLEPLNNATIHPGIDFRGSGALYVENCVIAQFNNFYEPEQSIGINFAPSGNAKLYVVDSIVKGNGATGGGGGIYIQPGSGATADVTIDRTRVENNRVGVFATAGGGAIKGMMRDSVVSGSTTWGIGVIGAKANLLVENTIVFGNNNGLVAESGGGMLVSHSSIVQNGTGLYRASGGALASYKNNNLNRNTIDGTFSSTLTQQ